MNNEDGVFKAIWKWWLLVFALGLAAAFANKALAATAEAPKDRTESQAVIEAQLKAFQENDAQRAFAYASPSVQRVFGDAGTFLSMVRRDYDVVYRPASVRFVGFERNGRQVAHSVQMIDQSRVLWNVYYLLEKLPEGGWRIFSCDIEKAATDLI